MIPSVVDCQPIYSAQLRMNTGTELFETGSSQERPIALEFGLGVLGLPCRVNLVPQLADLLARLVVGDLSRDDEP